MSKTSTTIAPNAELGTVPIETLDLHHIDWATAYLNRPFTLPFPAGIVTGGEECVERDGYVNKQTQIQELRNAGQRLDEYRSILYYNGTYANGGEPDELEDEINPVAHHSFDEIAAHDLSMQLVAAKRDRDRAKARAAKQAQQTAPAPAGAGEVKTPATAADNVTSK